MCVGILVDDGVRAEIVRLTKRARLPVNKSDETELVGLQRHFIDHECVLTAAYNDQIVHPLSLLKLSLSMKPTASNRLAASGWPPEAAKNPFRSQNRH